MYKHCLLSISLISISFGFSNEQLHPSKEALAGFITFIEEKTKQDFSNLPVFLSDFEQSPYENDVKLAQRIESLKQGYNEIDYGLHRNWSVDQRKQIHQALSKNVRPFDALERISVATKFELKTIESDRSLFNDVSNELAFINKGLYNADKIDPTYKKHSVPFKNGDNTEKCNQLVDIRVVPETIKIGQSIRLFYEIVRFGAAFFKNKQENKILARHDQICNVIMKSGDLEFINQNLIMKQSNK